MDLVLFLVITIIPVLIYLYIKWKFTHWTRKNIIFIEPKFEGIGDQIFQIYEKVKANGQKHGGCFAYLKPLYVPADLNIIKHIMQIDFNNFINRDVYCNEKSDPIRAHIFNLHDDKWKKLRTKLTPTFTSGKMKMMFNTLANTSSGLVAVLRNHASVNDPADIKSIVTRYTTDNIISCGFGVDCNTLEDPNSDFRKMGNLIFKHLGFRQKMLFILPRPLLFWFNVRLTDPEVQKFLLDFVRQIMEYREKNKVLRKDFMHLLLQLKNRDNVADDDNVFNDDNKGGNYLSLNEITAQCYVFFAAGFETSASTLTFAMYELAQHENVQEKLRQEIIQTLRKYEGKLTYEAVSEMEYLDKVVNETLRKWPPVIFVTRICKKDYQIPSTNATLNAGTTVIIPIRAIHHDPDYYPDPEKFDPERFSPESKNSRPAYAFMPFGEGPRICIGARFGHMQVKVGLTAILSKFKVTLHEKTQRPIQRSKNFVASILSDVWLNVEAVD